MSHVFKKPKPFTYWLCHSLKDYYLSAVYATRSTHINYYMHKKVYLLIFIAFLFANRLFAQNADVKQPLKNSGADTVMLDFHFNGFAFLDDHEYDALIPLRKTISGTRTEFDMGLHPDTLNSFVVGINALREFGGTPIFLTANPVVYYSYHSSHWLFDGGEFSRDGLLTQYPRALLNDTMIYYRPNVEGLLLRHQGERGYETGWIDWQSRQTATNRNVFLTGELGVFRPDPDGIFYTSHFFIVMHDAGTKPLLPNEPIQDNEGLQVRLGLDFSKRQHFMDSLSFEVGGMESAQRIRSEFNFKYAKGVVASFYMSHGPFSLYDEFYRGQPNYLMYGDPFYIKPIYNRLDVKITAFRRRRLTGSFMFSFDQSPGHPGDMSEVFHASYDLGRIRITTLHPLN